jgi:hypothetical protein
MTTPDRAESECKHPAWAREGVPYAHTRCVDCNAVYKETHVYVGQFDREAPDGIRMDRAEDAAGRWQDLYEAIAHGDEEHRAWLKEAIANWNKGKPVPSPRGKNSTAALEAERDRLRERELHFNEQIDWFNESKKLAERVVQLEAALRDLSYRAIGGLPCFCERLTRVHHKDDWDHSDACIAARAALEAQETP